MPVTMNQPVPNELRLPEDTLLAPTCGRTAATPGVGGEKIEANTDFPTPVEGPQRRTVVHQESVLQFNDVSWHGTCWPRGPSPPVGKSNRPQSRIDVIMSTEPIKPRMRVFGQVTEATPIDRRSA